MCSLLSNLAHFIEFWFQSETAEVTWQSANKVEPRLENRVQLMAHRSIEETMKNNLFAFYV